MEPKESHVPVVSLADSIVAECAPTGEEFVGAVCTGYVVISEWVDLEGNMQVTKVYSDPRGRIPPPWRVMGWLEFALRVF